jgi:hypothetical protein
VAWYAEFLLEIDLEILLRKTGARLNFKIAIVSLHIHPVLLLTGAKKFFSLKNNGTKVNVYNLFVLVGNGFVKQLRLD